MKRRSRFLLFLGTALILGLFLASGCSDSDSDGTAPPPPPEEQTLGPQGGTLASDDQNAQLVVPAGALDQETTFQLAAVNMPDPQDGLIANRAYQLDAGTETFLQDVTLSISYDPDDVPNGVDEGEMALYQYLNNTWVEVPGSQPDIANHEVSASFGGPGGAGFLADPFDPAKTDFCLVFSPGRILISGPPHGSTTYYTMTSVLTENDCATSPAPLGTNQHVTISEDGSTVTFMDITGTWDGSCIGSGEKQMTIPVDVENNCWCHITMQFTLFFTDRNHFTGTFHVQSDYTAGCEAEDCSYAYDLTGVHED